MHSFTLIILFIIFMTAWYLFKTQHEKYLENEPSIIRLKNKLTPVFPELKFVKVMKGDSSYTINKRNIYICTEANGETYDDNMLTYVTLHELAHTLCPEIGHGAQFQRIFETLLGRAERHKLFDPRKPRTENYCNVKKIKT